MFKHSTLLTGPGTVEVESHDLLAITTDSPCMVSYVSTNGDLTNIALTTPHKPFKVRALSNGSVFFVDCPDLGHWGYDIFCVTSKLDPTPFEVPEEMRVPETIEDKLKRMVVDLFEHSYGENSNAVETFEEAMDFDIDDDGFIGNPLYNVAPLTEEEPAPPTLTEPLPVDQGSQVPPDEPPQTEPDPTPVDPPTS